MLEGQSTIYPVAAGNMNHTNPFESLESRVLMSITHAPVFNPPHQVESIILPLAITGSPKVAAVTAPAALKAQRIGTSELFLTWQGDGSATLGYTIQRSSNGTSGWNNIGTAAVTGRSFMISNLTMFSRYFYRVVAAGSGGTVAFSNVVGTPPRKL
jgi:hypothetical protein